MPVSAINGRRVRYRRWGSDGPWVTLVHGGLVHGGSWQTVATCLAEGRRVLAPDLAGYGDSDPRPDGPSVDGFAADLVRLWDHLGVQRSAVVGFSMGGFVALETALTDPDRVVALGLIGTAPAVSPPAREAFAGRAKRIDQQGLTEEVGLHLRRVFSDGFREAHPERVAAYAAEVGRVRPEVLAATFRALAAFDREADLPRVRCPALVLVGAEDAAIGTAGSEALAAGLPAARLSILPGAGHTVHMEQTRQVIALLDAFLVDAL